jgi:probable F420-dependent oxidoreductase
MTAEEGGFDSLWVGDHVAFPADISEVYPFTESGNPPAGIDSSQKVLTPFETLSYLAGITSSITVGTNVGLAPLYHPIRLTKQSFTLSALSEGRFDLGVGIGWMPEEYDLLDIPWGERGSRFDEFLDLYTRALDEPELTFDGQHHSFSETGFHPVPDETEPTLLIGGKSGATFRRIGEFADGWTIVRDSPGEVREASKRLNNAWSDYDRDGSPQIVLVRPVHVGSDRQSDSPLVGTPTKIKADIRDYADAGVTQFGFMFYTTDVNEQERQLNRLATEVLPDL